MALTEASTGRPPARPWKMLRRFASSSLVPDLSAALILLAFSVMPGMSAELAADNPEALKFFENRIRPLLADQCFKCHGENKQKGDLRLDSQSAVLQGGSGGAAVVPGDPAQSLLMKAVSYEDADLQMPPDNKLEPAQIADLR